MFKELFLESEVDKNGVSIPDQATPQEDLKNVYVRNEDRRYSYLDSNHKDMPFSNQRLVIGWFATKYNMAEGYIVQQLSRDEKKEFGDAFRVYSNKGTTIVKLDLKSGKIAFIDNEYYTENDKVKFQKAFVYHRLFIDNTHNALKAFGLK